MELYTEKSRGYLSEHLVQRKEAQERQKYSCFWHSLHRLKGSQKFCKGDRKVKLLIHKCTEKKKPPKDTTQSRSVKEAHLKVLADIFGKEPLRLLYERSLQINCSSDDISIMKGEVLNCLLSFSIEIGWKQSNQKNKEEWLTQASSLQC